MVERLHAKLGYPERCPHGWPVAAGAGARGEPRTGLAGRSGEGDAGEIVRQSEQDGDLLSWFASEGLTPGAKVEIRDIQPAAGIARSRSTAMSSSSPTRPHAVCSSVARRATNRRVKAPLLTSRRLLDVIARSAFVAASEAATSTLLNCFLREGGNGSFDGDELVLPGARRRAPRSRTARRSSTTASAAPRGATASRWRCRNWPRCWPPRSTRARRPSLPQPRPREPRRR